MLDPAFTFAVTMEKFTTEHQILYLFGCGSSVVSELMSVVGAVLGDLQRSGDVALINA